MSSDVWVGRAPWDVAMPTTVDATDLVEYKLRGDGNVYGPQPAGRLFWGRHDGPADESGQIVAYRLIKAVAAEPERKHGHYFKPVSGLAHVDVYRALELFGVTDPCLQHAIKKLLVAGGRGAGKDIRQDVAEAIDSLRRWQEMRAEDEQRARVA